MQKEKLKFEIIFHWLVSSSSFKNLNIFKGKIIERNVFNPLWNLLSLNAEHYFSARYIEKVFIIIDYLIEKNENIKTFLNPSS